MRATEGKILAVRNFSEHPGDWYLEVVLVHLDADRHDPFVTWMYNTQDGGFFEGHYYKTFMEAYMDFIQRSRSQTPIYYIWLPHLMESKVLVRGND